jgi:AcrR family transcriptional regulator
MATGPGLRERKKQKTRWAIQEHALRLFAQQGYDATTVDQIAAAAEISPSTFFRYFKTKEDVVIEDQYDPIMVELLAAAPAEGSPIEAMRFVLHQAFDGMGDAERQKIFERIRLVMSVPALRARTFENFTGTSRLIAESVARRVGRDAGEFDIQVFAGACLGAWVAALLEWAEHDGEEDIVELLDRALAMLESGLRL